MKITPRINKEKEPLLYQVLHHRNKNSKDQEGCRLDPPEPAPAENWQQCVQKYGRDGAGAFSIYAVHTWHLWEGLKLGKCDFC
jgi:hypothetical protein